MKNKGIKISFLPKASNSANGDNINKGESSEIIII